jgi:ribosomal protein S18 acetylase RimI-like enzyme
MHTVSVRKFEKQDSAALVALWKQVFPDDPPHNEPSAVIAAKLKVDDLIFVAEHGVQIVGACMAGYDGHRGWLYAVAVSPEHRRAGTGTLLVNAAVEELKKLGCIKVNLQIRSTNAPVAAFYKSLGFVAEDRLSMGVFIK